MKNNFLIGIFAIIIFPGTEFLFAQNTFPNTGSVGIGTLTPNASSILEMVSTDKGVLVPRMTKTQRDAITAPATGLLIYQTNSTAGFYYYDGAQWTAVTPKNKSWALTGNSGTDPSNNFIGTTDAQPLLFKAGNQKSGYISTSLADGNTGFGYQTLNAGTGVQNAAFGYGALSYNTSGVQNTAVGYSALGSNTVGKYNTAIGFESLTYNTTGNQNEGVGFYSLYSNTTGSDNTANGFEALFSNTTGLNNTASGMQSLYTNTTGYDNVATGNYTLYANTSGTNNTANGYQALYSNTTGFDNTSMGVGALFLNTTGNFNAAQGYDALYSNTTGWGNTAFGGAALSANTIGHDNSALGDVALNGNTSGIWNVGAGSYSLYYNTTGSNNAALGYQALYLNSTGLSNTAVGLGSLVTNTTGFGNTGLGISAYASWDNLSNSTVIGGFATVNVSNEIVIGNDAVNVIGGQVGWSTFSDGRFKKDIKENVPGLLFINKLKPVTYHVEARKIEESYGRPDSQLNMLSDAYDKAESKLRTGLVAQDVEKAAKEIGYEFDGVNAPQNEKDHYSLVYADFVPSLIKAVQELSKQNDEIVSEISSLKSELASLRENNSERSTGSNPKLQGSNICTLSQNIPNPSFFSSIINYYIPDNLQHVQLVITDEYGKTMQTYSINQTGEGQQVIYTDQLTPGSYRYSLYADGKLIASKQMMIVK